LEAEEAFRKKKGSEIEKLAGELAGNEKDLKDATVIREHDRKAFLEEERTLIESIDALERSLEVLAKKAPTAALPQTGSASLVNVATTLRRLAERSPDFALNAGQQSILDSFFQNAVASQNRRSGSSLDFLQLDSLEDEDGDFESKAGGVTETLQKILVKTKAEKDEQAKKEQEAQINYKALAEPLKREIEDQTKAMTEKKRQVAKSEQISAEKTAELTAANELLQVTEKHLEDVKTQCIQKAIDWHARTDKRSDEITAIQMALKILTSAAAKAMRSKQSLGANDFAQVSFLQTRQTSKRVMRALSKLRAAGTPSLSLLAMRAHRRLISTSAADPFADVKRMVQDMLVKLQKEMAEEAKKKEWCDKEMGQSAKSKHTKEKEIDKLSSRIEQLEADVEELTDSLEQLSKDTAEAAHATSTATKIRGEEKMENLKAIKEYQDAQTLLTNAMTVLKEFYEKESFAQTGSDAAPPDTGDIDDEYESDAAGSASGGGSGIIGILEIAVADFAQLEEATTTAESSAAHEYEEFMKEMQIQQAVWAKDVEYKSTAKVKTEGDLQRAKTDLAGYQKELDAVNLYIEKLKPDCTTQPDSYEERKKRRDAELKSLQEALAILNGDAIA